MSPLIVYDHAHQRNCWLFTTRKPQVLQLLRRMFRYNKASSMNVLHSILRLPIRHGLPMKAKTKTSGTMKCQSKHEQRERNSENKFRRTKQQKSYGHRSSVPCDKTQKQLERSLKQARTARKGVETLQDLSYLFQKGHCEHQRNGFLQVRVAGMRKSIKKNTLKKKDGERNFHFPSCTPRCASRSQSDETHEWNRWMKFSAGFMLTDEEVRQLTDAGCEI